MNGTDNSTIGTTPPSVEWNKSDITHDYPLANYHRDKGHSFRTTEHVKERNAEKSSQIINIFKNYLDLR